MSTHNLNPRQLAFANRILDGDCTQEQAAIDAGYAKKTARSQASALMTNPNIVAYIAEQRSKLQESAIASREDVLKAMSEILHGKHSAEGKRDAAGRTAAAREISKISGYYEPEKLEVSGSFVDRIRRRSK
jgi:phage terminase small subunit